MLLSYNYLYSLMVICILDGKTLDFCYIYLIVDVRSYFVDCGFIFKINHRLKWCILVLKTTSLAIYNIIILDIRSKYLQLW